MTPTHGYSFVSNNEIDVSVHQHIVTKFLDSEDVRSRQVFSYQESLAYSQKVGLL